MKALRFSLAVALAAATALFGCTSILGVTDTPNSSGDATTDGGADGPSTADSTADASPVDSTVADTGGGGSDGANDAAQQPDVADAASDGTTCDPATHHVCGGNCVSSADPATCGMSCTSCPTPDGGAASCTPGDGGYACGVTCDPDAGLAACGSACVPFDPYASNVVLLMHFDGPNGSTTFTDQVGHPVTAQGSADISTAQSKFGGASGYFDNPTGGSYLTIPNSPEWDLTNGDSTVEMWIYPLSWPTSTPVLLSQSPTGNDGQWSVIADTRVGSPSIWIGHNGGGSEIRSTGGLALNTWAHVAIERSSGSTLIFVNGVLLASATVNPYTSTSNSLYIAAGNTNTYGCTYCWNGYIDELRITKGVARYTTNFAPPTAAFPDVGLGGCGCKTNQTLCGSTCIDDASLLTDANNCGTCGHSCLGGTCGAGKCQPFAIATGLISPFSMATTDTESYLYVGGATGGKYIYKIAKDGSGTTTIGPSPTQSWGIGEDPQNAYVYTGSGYKVPTDGGVYVQLPGGAGGNNVRADATHAYFGGCTSALDICASPIDGGAPTLIYDGGGAYALSIDSTYAYTAPAAGLIRVPLAGGPIDLLVAGASTTYALENDGALIYWGGAGVYKVPIDGGTDSQIVPNGANVYFMAIDATNVYWTSQSTSTVNMVAKTGGAVTQLASGMSNPAGIRVDPKAVYWCENGAGRVWKLAK